MPNRTDINELDEVWEARAEGLGESLEADYCNVLHCPHPFALGGNAEVIQFDDHIEGSVYVTIDLTGKPGDSYAEYELMICHRDDTTWGADIISRLAPYTLKSHIAAGETMDLDQSTPTESRIKALIFDTYQTFKMFGATYELRLCMGITKDELQFTFDHGPKPLLAKLKEARVYPYTDLNRHSVLKPMA